MLASDSRRYVCRLLLPERFLARTPFFSAPPEQADRPTIISRASRVVFFGDPVDSNFQGASSRGSRNKSGALSGHPTISGIRLTEGIEIAYPAQSVGFPLDVRACRQYLDGLATISRRTRKPRKNSVFTGREELNGTTRVSLPRRRIDTSVDAVLRGNSSLPRFGAKKPGPDGDRSGTNK